MSIQSKINFLAVYPYFTAISTNMGCQIQWNVSGISYSDKQANFLPSS